MTNHEITDKQLQSAFIMFFLGSLIVMGFSSEAKQDSWISVLFTGILFLPLMALYLRVIHLYPGLNLFEILLKVFGSIFGRILSCLLIFFAIHLGSMVINLFAQFNYTQGMSETPKFMMVSFIILLCIWSVENGPENIARVSKFIWPLLAASICLTTIIAIKDMNLNNLKPIMETNFKSLLNGAFSYLTLSFGEVFLCLCLFSSVSSKSNSSKIFIKSFIPAILIILVVNLRNVLVLGVPTASISNYPSYQCGSVISVGEFFTRVEVLVSINLLLTGFIKICICLYAASLGLSKVLNISNQKALVVPCGLLIATLSGLLNSSSQTQMQWLKAFPIYAIPFEIILPLILWVGAEIQSKIKSSGNRSTADSK